MTVDDLIYRLLQLEGDEPVVWKGPEYAASIPVEVTRVQRAYIPADAIVARADVCLITADPDAQA